MMNVKNDYIHMIIYIRSSGFGNVQWFSYLLLSQFLNNMKGTYMMEKDLHDTMEINWLHVASYCSDKLWKHPINFLARV